MVYIWILIVIAILAGVNSVWLWYQHYRYEKMKKDMVCPVGFHCAEVVNSGFGKTMGVSNDIWGVLYYLFILVLLFAYLYISVDKPLLSQAILFLSVFSAIFSTYLLIVQAFILRKWCFWCLIAIALNYSFLGVDLAFFFS